MGVSLSLLMYYVLSHSVVSDFLQPHGLEPSRPLCPWGFCSQEYWSGLAGPPPGDLPSPGIQPRSRALQVDSLPFESPGKPKNTGVGNLSFLQGIFPNWAGVSSIAGGFFTSWAIRETCWCIIMRSSRDQLSAFLDLVGFNEFRYCPQWLSFFLRLCPATFLSQKDSLPIWLWSMADFKLPWQSWANQAYHL